MQIGKDIRMFTRALDFICVCAYGGSAVGDQISALKRGAEVGRLSLLLLSVLHWRIDVLPAINILGILRGP